MPVEGLRITTIDLAKEYLKFSAAHFTVFSATERERLHGHNFQVSAEIDAPVGDNGMCFSYKLFKQKLRDLCNQLDEYLLLPEYSPYLSITEDGANYRVVYNNETMTFLKADTQLLPIRNTTVEEFAHLLSQRLLEDKKAVQEYGILRIKIRVSSGPGQTGSFEWHKSIDDKEG